MQLSLLPIPIPIYIYIYISFSAGFDWYAIDVSAVSVPCLNTMQNVSVDSTDLILTPDLDETDTVFCTHRYRHAASSTASTLSPTQDAIAPA